MNKKSVLSFLGLTKADAVVLEKGIRTAAKRAWAEHPNNPKNKQRKRRKNKCA